MTKEKRRPRRIAADEAHAWARNLRLNNAQAKLVLSMLTLYVDGDGYCFVAIPSLADDTELSAQTVRRRLAWLEEIGAIARLPQWLDEHGRRNGDGRGKRTSDLIKLLLDADTEDVEAAAAGRPRDDVDVTGDGHDPDDRDAISPISQIGLIEDAKTVSPTVALPQPYHCGKGLNSEPEPEPESSPQPPSGGRVAEENSGWNEFETAWQEPILRQSLAHQAWLSLDASDRALALRAAQGYIGRWKAQKSRPRLLGAHLFLRERAAWPAFAAYAPDAKVNASGYASDSREGRAIVGLYAVARTRPFEHKGRISYRGEITAQMLAFADIANADGWLWITDRNQIAAWSTFVAAHVFGGRPSLTVKRGAGSAAVTGITAPWPWPPRVDGTLARSSDDLMTDDDFKNFHG